MKKYLLGVLVITGVFSLSSSYASNALANVTWPCINKLPSAEILQVRVITANINKVNSVDEKVKKMKTDLLKKLTLATCSSKSLERFADKSIKNLAQIKPEINAFYQAAIDTNGKTSNIPETNEPLLLLTNHIHSYFGVLSPDVKYVMNSANWTMSFDMKKPDIWTIKWKISGKTQGRFDILKWYFDMNLDGDMSFSIQNPFIKDPVNLTAKWSVSLINNGSTYVKFNTLAMDITLPPILASEFDSLDMTNLKKIVSEIPNRTKDTYIALWDPNMSPQTSLNIFPKNRWTFTSKEDNIAYGMPSLDWCELMASPTFTQTKCEKAMKNVKLWTQWKGILFIKNDNGVYTMWFTKKFLWKNIINHIPAYYYDKPLIKWNAESIVSIAIPFEASGKTGIYRSADLPLSIRRITPTWDILLKFSVRSPTESKIDTTITNKETKTKYTGKYDFKRTDKKNDLTRDGIADMTILDWNNKKLWTISWKITATQSPIAAFVPSVPKKTMTIDKFFQQFDIESLLNN